MDGSFLAQIPHRRGRDLRCGHQLFLMKGRGRKISEGCLCDGAEGCCRKALGHHVLRRQTRIPCRKGARASGGGGGDHGHRGRTIVQQLWQRQQRLPME